MDSSRMEREVRGIPLWLLAEYLVEFGGKQTEPGRVQGKGWNASLIQLEDYRVGSLAVGQVQIKLEGSPDAMAELLPQLEKKLLRAGG